MDYLTSIYSNMGRELDPDESYFVRDGRFATLDQLARAVPPGRLLDVGCGRGLLLRRLADYHRVFGCDFDVGAVEACRQAGFNVTQVDLNDAITLGAFEGESFDVIVISEVCEHLLNPRTALRLARRHIASSGTLIVTVPNAVPLFARPRILLGSRVDWLHYPSQDTEVTGHIRFYTIASMSALLQSEGFTVERVQGVSFRMNGKFWERLCYWLARVLRNDPTQLDIFFGRTLPGLSPGLVFLCRPAD